MTESVVSSSIGGGSGGSVGGDTTVSVVLGEVMILYCNLPTKRKLKDNIFSHVTKESEYILFAISH